jgi:hypothetical protein
MPACIEMLGANYGASQLPESQFQRLSTPIVQQIAEAIHGEGNVTMDDIRAGIDRRFARPENGGSVEREDSA